MSNQEFNPNNNPGSVEEQIPHSGVHGYEKPVTEFGSTTLHEAHEQGLLETPENPSPLIETPINPNKKRKLTRKQRITIGVTAAALGSTVPFGLAMALNGGENTPPTPNTNNSSTNTGSGETTGQNPEAPAAEPFSDSEIQNINDTCFIDRRYPNYAEILKTIDGSSANEIRSVMSNVVVGDIDSEASACGSIAAIFSKAGF
jgi:hypothetical protein